MDYQARVGYRSRVVAPSNVHLCLVYWTHLDTVLAGEHALLEFGFTYSGAALYELLLLPTGSFDRGTPAHAPKCFPARNLSS